MDYRNKLLALKSLLRKIKERFSLVPSISLHKSYLLAVVIFLVSSLFVGVYLVQHQQIFKPRAQEAKNNEVPKSYGYIVEFKEEPLAKKVGKVSALSVQDQQSKLDEEHQQAKQDVFNILNEGKVKTFSEEEKQSIVAQEYTKTFNGIALNIDGQQAEKLKTSKHVKGVYPNYEVEALLNESVPLVKANQVWDLRDLRSQGIAGEGVRIAILDSGVDVTHADLGGTVIPTGGREFNSPGAIHLWDPYDPYDKVNPQLISVNNNRVAYPVNGNILIRVLDTSRMIAEGPIWTVIPLPNQGRLKVRKIVLSDNFLVFYGVDDNAQGSIYLHDLTNRTTQKVSDASMIGNIYISNNKVIYEKDRSLGRVIDTGIYIYDVLTSAETLLSITSGRLTTFFNPRVSGEFVLYSVSDSIEERCYSRAILRNITSNEDRDVTPQTSFGAILDFQGSKFIYLDCQDNTVYHLYDYDTRQSTRISLGSRPTVSSIDLDAVKVSGGGISGRNYSWIILPLGNPSNLAEIEEGLVFFSKNGSNRRVMAYDLSLNRVVQINIDRSSNSFTAERDWVCFVDDLLSLLCHKYKPESSYLLPETVYNQKVVDGYNFIESEDMSLDDNGHGTHVAAIAASSGSLKGVAPGAKLVSYKVMDSYGRGYVSNIIAALERVVSTKADVDLNNDIGVVNISLGVNCRGIYDSQCGPDDPLSRSVDNTVDAGVTVVVAAGNRGPNASTIDSPGTARKAITVGAVYKSLALPGFSSNGPIDVGAERIYKPDVVAPGVSICAAEWRDYYRYSRCVDQQHIALEGTSMASPHVAGVAALIKQARPEWTAQQVKEAIMNSAVNLHFNRDAQGRGLVDALAAIRLALSSNTPTPISTPTPSPITLSLDNNIVVAGTTVNVGWNNLNNGLEKDWVAIFKQSDPSTAQTFKEWLFLGSCSKQSQGRIPGSSGSCSVTVPNNLPVGVYELRLMTNNTYNVVATSQSLIVGGGNNFIVAADPSSVKAGERVNLSWSGITTFKEKDWVGMFKTGDSTSAGYLKEWIFLATCSKKPQSSSVPGPAGVCNMTIPANISPGTYEFRFMTDNQYQVIGTTRSINVSR